MKIKSLPTEYRGVEYRSRTEARWAVFFTENDIPFHYESEGFDLDGIWYLPDFWLPEGKCWFEVKPYDPSSAESEKARRLARGTGRMVFVAPGNPKADIGLLAFSPTGKVQTDWRFAYAYGDGVGYIACDTWRADLWVKIRQTEASVGTCGMNPGAELNKAGSHQFSSSRQEPRRSGTITVPRGRVLEVPRASNRRIL